MEILQSMTFGPLSSLYNNNIRDDIAKSYEGSQGTDIVNGVEFKILFGSSTAT